MYYPCALRSKVCCSCGRPRGTLKLMRLTPPRPSCTYSHTGFYGWFVTAGKATAIRLAAQYRIGIGGPKCRKHRRVSCSDKTPHRCQGGRPHGAIRPRSTLKPVRGFVTAGNAAAEHRNIRFGTLKHIKGFVIAGNATAAPKTGEAGEVSVSARIEPKEGAKITVKVLPARCSGHVHVMGCMSPRSAVCMAVIPCRVRHLQ